MMMGSFKRLCLALLSLEARLAAFPTVLRDASLSQLTNTFEVHKMGILSTM